LETPTDPEVGVSNAPTNNTNSGNTDSSVWKSKAMSLMGVPYVWGGKSARGTDCSGFTTQVMESMGVKLPRRSADQYNVGESVSRENLQEGDLVFFNTAGNGVSHVGIYLGEGKFINANSYVEKVAIDDLNSAYWAARYLGARRVLSATTTASR
jgi:peptidoglycan DL-endopeptidase LytE